MLKKSVRIIKIFAFVMFILIPMFFAIINNNVIKNTRASDKRVDINIDYDDIKGPVPLNWRALAQGGEEKGVQMLSNVISKVSVLSPRYIRIDHIYDFYDVLSKDQNGTFNLNWDKLDATVCDIYRTGAKPFFVLGYMPEALSDNTDLISIPKKWFLWSFLVQKTVERYSGKDTRLCGQVKGDFMNNIYYEVWNEPDLETFGKWSSRDGAKSYLDLYQHSAQAASQATNVNHFYIGGPVTTALYKNWITNFLDFVDKNNLRLDFISWHHYSKNPNDYSQDLVNINQWLDQDKYIKFSKLPKIISEWGYDSNLNPISENNLGAVHTFVSIRNLIEQKLEMAFAFEIKDGLSSRWGLLTNNGDEKPRYKVLRMLNMISGHLLNIQGENENIKVLASRKEGEISVMIGNYDVSESSYYLVPLSIVNIPNGDYTVIVSDTEHVLDNKDISISNGQYSSEIALEPNKVMGVSIQKK